MNLIIPPPTIGKIVSLRFFYKDGFGIKLPTKVDMPLYKETKQNQANHKQFEKYLPDERKLCKFYMHLSQYRLNPFQSVNIYPMMKYFVRIFNECLAEK